MDKFNLQDAFFAFIILALLVLIGRAIRQRIGLFRSLYLPSSIVAGGLGLFLGPEVLGAIARLFDPQSPFADGLFPETVRTVWSQSPGIFINVVFASLFLGHAIPSPKSIWRKAAPQVIFGQTIAWGQYVVGLLLAVCILTPIFHLSPIAGALIEIGFEGGHGTAGGMRQTLTELGFAEGSDLALGMATVGIISGIVLGTLIADWGRRKGYVQIDPEETLIQGGDSKHPGQESPETAAAREALLRDLLIDPLSLNLGFVGVSILIGWVLLQGMIFFEAITWGSGEHGVRVIEAVPLFPMALLGGLIVQVVAVRLHLDLLIIRPLMERIAGVALDITIIAAIATISLQGIGSNFIPFLILSVAGIAWNVSAFLFLAPRLLPTYWFERGIGDMGQSMGVTSTGILLLRMIDPHDRSGAFESFAYKQLLFEPIVGGGLFTGTAPSLIAQFGPIPILLLTSAILAAWLIFGFIAFGRQVRA